MAIAVDPKREIEYVLEEDRGLDESEQTIFLLSPLTARQAADVADRFSEAAAQFDKSGAAIGQKVSMRYHAKCMALIGLGLNGWRNFKDSEGEPVPFNIRTSGTKRTIDPRTIDRMTLGQVMEIAEAIEGNAQLSDEAVRD